MSIDQDIYKAVIDFVQHHAHTPSCLYLGKNQWQKVLKEISVYDIQPHSDSRSNLDNQKMYRGMYLFIVDVDNHLKVA